jgi:hypothetical protein
MRMIKATLLAAALAVVSFAGGPDESFAGVPTVSAIAPAATASVQASPTEQVWWRGGGGRGWGGRGWGWRGRGWGGGGWGGGGWCYYHPRRCGRY